MLNRPQLQLYIFRFVEKKIKENVSLRFTIRSHRQALISLGGADLESIRPERGIRRCRHHQPPSITNFMMLTAVHE